MQRKADAEMARDMADKMAEAEAAADQQAAKEMAAQEEDQAGAKVVVEVNIQAEDAADVDTLASTLGTGAALETKIKSDFDVEGLGAPISVSAPVKDGGLDKSKHFVDLEVTMPPPAELMRLAIEFTADQIRGS